MLEDRVPEELIMHVSDPEEQETRGEKSDDELVLTPSPVEDEPDEEIILTLSPTEEKAEKDELILESEIPEEPEEITFDGESESEAKIKAAMEAYDAAMDKAAGMPGK